MRFIHTLSSVLLGLVLASGAAQAAPITLDIETTIVSKTSGLLDPLDIVGDPLLVRLFLDDAQPDEDPTAGLYAATAPGDASYIGNPYGEATGEPIQSVTADAGAGTWSFAADASHLLGLFDVTVAGTLTGQSLVPDQILPELGPASGQLVFTLEGTGGAQFVAEVNQVALPEPGLAGLAGAVLLAFGARHAARASRGRDA